jgi:hypothetical protein
MAISAEIDRVEIEGNNLRLHLRPTREFGGGLSIPGQKLLIVQDFKFMPHVGQVIWGGSQMVRIEPGMGVEAEQAYWRISTVRMVEYNPLDVLPDIWA